MSGGRIVIAVSLVLAGCVPPGTSRLPEAAPKRSNDPHIEPLMDGLIDETPIWEARPVTANATTIAQTNYVVRPGDGLRSIGETTGAGSETIARVNNLVAPYVLRPGQVLRIPAGRYHRVGTGETGIAIARAYGIAWNTIVTTNGLTEPFVLRIGQRLLLPGTATPNAEARAAAFKIDIDDIATGGTPARPLVGPFLETPQTIFAGRFSWPMTGTIAERSYQSRNRNRGPRWQQHSSHGRRNSGFCRQWRFCGLWRIDPCPSRRRMDQRLWPRCAGDRRAGADRKGRTSDRQYRR
jgi:lipoprotein NlpD